MKLDRFVVLILGALSGVLCVCAPAQSFTLTVSGSVSTFTGHISPGDGKSFRELLNAPRPQPIRVLYLQSGGGSVSDGIEIARAVRRAGLVTAVDASGATCGSACTMIFIAGVRRHYVHGDSVREGFSSMTGLGFHRAHKGGNYNALLSSGDTDRMCALYAEMGVPRACDLVMGASFGPQFRPSGETALKLGIATSLEAP